MQISKSALAFAVTAALSSQASADFKPQAAPDAPHGKPAASNSLPHFRFPVRTHATNDAVLYDQSGVADGIAPAQDYQSSLDAYDSEGADDFVVTDPAGWTVSAFNFQVSFASSPPAGTTYDIDVYEDANGQPGASACAYAALSGTLDASETALSVALPSPCMLIPGRYWIAFSAKLDFPPKMYWMTGAGSSIDNIGEWREPGDGNGTGCTDWTAMSSCTTVNNVTVGSGDFNLLFQVVGSVGINAGCTPGGICLDATVGTDLTPGACASTDAIDATVGDQLNFCYVLTNNTGIELDYHTLSDNVNGSIFTLLNHAVPAGGTFQFNRIATAGTTQAITASWTARDVPPGYAAEVVSGGGCIDRIFADGYDNASVPCAGGGFVDITGSGTPLGLGDDSSVDVTMPFSFNFYGTTSNVLTVSNNGGVLFNNPGSGLPFINTPLPAGLSSSAILPLWDDFDSEQGDVYTDIRGATPNRQFIVEWFNRVHYDGSSNTDGATFELILNEDGTIQFEYADVDYSSVGNLSGDPDDCTDGVCATIGLQSDSTLFNQFSAFEASVTDGSGIQWTANAPQAFTSADTVTVNVGAPQIVVNPATLSGSGAPGASGSIPFAIENHGNRDLNWSLDEAAPSNLHFAPPGSRFAMPMGDPAKSTTARPPIVSPHPRKPDRHAGHGHPIVLAPGVTALAADAYFDEFYTLDVTANNGINPLGGAGGTAFGFKFLDGDFSKAYGIDKFGSQIDTFASISAADGTITPIGLSNASADQNGFTGFAQDPTTGTLYASGTSCGSSSHLYTVDRNTGATTLVGAMPDMGCAIWIAISPDGFMYSVDVINDALYAVDKTSGATSLKGSVGFNTNYGQDADFDQSTGILYWAAFNADTFEDEIRTVDLDTGAASLVYSLGFTQIVGLATETVGGPCAQPQDLPWLSLSPTTGTTAPAGSSPVTASIDGSGTVDGDVLSGTVCVSSNDPLKHTVEVPLQYTVATPPPPSVTKAFEPPSVGFGETSTLSITLSNGAGVASALTADLVDTFPAGLTIAPTPNASSDCGGTVTSSIGGVTLTGAGSAIPAGGSCTVHVDVVATGFGTFANVIAAGDLQTTTGSNTVPATATLTESPAAPTLTKAFAPASVVAGASSTLTVTLANSNPVAATLASALTDTFPPGLVVAAPANASTTCLAGLQAAPASDHVTLDGGAVIPPNGTCTITVDTAAAAPGSYANSIAVDALQTDVGSNAQSADATLDVVPIVVPPTVSKEFVPASVVAGVPSTLTITLTNINLGAASLTSALTDTFPPGLVVATPANASSTCGGAVTAVDGADSVTLDAAGSAIPGTGACTISVDVESVTPNAYDNVIDVGALQTDVGSNIASGTATLNVTP
jgi:hypothetical protein